MNVLAQHQQQTPKRNRSREGAGKSAHSWFKHDLLRRVVGGQLGRYRLNNSGRVLLIDGNAGDGEGVPEIQSNFFGWKSCPTAELLTRAAVNVGDADVLLCERNEERRRLVEEHFPQAAVVGNHEHAPDCIRSDHRYVLWLSDPCGPSGHGVDVMAAVARRIASDFVIVLNEGWIRERLIDGRPHEKTLIHRERYAPMVDPSWWREKLDRRHIARTRTVIRASNNFKFRILVVSNFLSDAAMRGDFEVII